MIAGSLLLILPSFLSLINPAIAIDDSITVTVRAADKVKRVLEASTAESLVSGPLITDGSNAADPLATVSPAASDSAASVASVTTAVAKVTTSPSSVDGSDSSALSTFSTSSIATGAVSGADRVSGFAPAVGFGNGSVATTAKVNGSSGASNGSHPAGGNATSSLGGGGGLGLATTSGNGAPTGLSTMADISSTASSTASATRNSTGRASGSKSANSGSSYKPLNWIISLSAGAVIALLA